MFAGGRSPIILAALLLLLPLQVCASLDWIAPYLPARLFYFTSLYRCNQTFICHGDTCSFRISCYCLNGHGEPVIPCPFLLRNAARVRALAAHGPRGGRTAAWDFATHALHLCLGMPLLLPYLAFFAFDAASPLRLARMTRAQTRGRAACVAATSRRHALLFTCLPAARRTTPPSACSLVSSSCMPSAVPRTLVWVRTQWRHASTVCHFRA